MTDAMDATDVIRAGSGGPAVPPVAAAAPSGRPGLLVPVPELPGPDDAGQPRLVLGFRQVGAETVAEAFTSLDRLVDACGPAQPWAAFSVADSITLLADAGASVLIVDPGIAGDTVGVDLTCLASTAGGATR